MQDHNLLVLFVKEGIEVILINSNPATIMTDPSMADHVYLKPLTTKSIIEILKRILKLMRFTNDGRTNSFNLCLEAEREFGRFW
jgi:carbamoyl-phosphate synthase large subunit